MGLIVQGDLWRENNDKIEKETVDVNNKNKKWFRFTTVPLEPLKICLIIDDVDIIIFNISKKMCRKLVSTYIV